VLHFAIIQRTKSTPHKPIKLEELLRKMGAAFERKSVHDKKIRDAKIQELIRYPSKVFDQD